jgi:precorrin-6B methylase 2
MNIYPAAAYLRHLLAARSTAGHGVHSPFVYDFLTKVVRNKTDNKIVSQVEGLRREMLSDKRRIMVTDLGAGSVTKAGGERRVAEIAGSAALPARETGLLVRMVQGAGYRVQGSGPNVQISAAHGRHITEPDSIILELGTSLGISTLALALAAPERRVITVEGCPVMAAIARENLQRYDASNAEVVNAEFSEALERLRNDGLNVSFAFIDGNHRGAALTEYVSKIAAMGDEMTIVADDIHLTKEMFQAWKSLAASGITPVTMETLRLGIFFLKLNITPGRYRIRY